MNKTKRILAILGAAGATLVVLPMFAAFEAHVVNVTATIENALSVPVDPIAFGTVFPQEHLNKSLNVSLSRSFLTENRVDDVSYIIRQKPKCAVTTNNGQTLVGPTKTGEVVPNGQGGYEIDCGPDPRQKDSTGQPLPLGSSWGVLPSLCEYISKEPDNRPENDGSLASFHHSFTVGTSTVNWLDTKGHLAKSESDIEDNWTIDLSVPCFGGYCAQDWASFVHGINPQANPDEFTQPILNEHKVFGCDLWVEVTGVSEQTET